MLQVFAQSIVVSRILCPSLRIIGHLPAHVVNVDEIYSEKVRISNSGGLATLILDRVIWYKVMYQR